MRQIKPKQALLSGLIEEPYSITVSECVESKMGKDDDEYTDEDLTSTNAKTNETDNLFSLGIP